MSLTATDSDGTAAGDFFCDGCCVGGNGGGDGFCDGCCVGGNGGGDGFCDGCCDGGGDGGGGDGGSVGFPDGRGVTTCVGAGDGASWTSGIFEGDVDTDNGGLCCVGCWVGMGGDCGINGNGCCAMDAYTLSKVRFNPTVFTTNSTHPARKTT